jgi:hypothetical protein
MLSRRRLLVAIAVLLPSIPAAAQSPTPTTTALDGTYFGVSRTFEEEAINGGKTWARYCLQYGPGTLSIVNGIAKAGKLEGSISPQGVLIMRSFWDRFDGRIDSQGTVRGRSTGVCSYQWVWQKVPLPTMPFDGDYVGVSRELAGEGAKCLSNGVPATLIVRNSVVLGHWQGTVSTQGALAIHSGNMQLDGRIDGQGIIRGQGRAASGCVYAYVWHKQPG